VVENCIKTMNYQWIILGGSCLIFLEQCLALKSYVSKKKSIRRVNVTRITYDTKGGKKYNKTMINFYTI